MKAGEEKIYPTPNSSPTNYTQASLDGGDTYSYSYICFLTKETIIVVLIAESGEEDNALATSMT